MLSAVCLCLGAGWTADRLGLGVALGAFIGGILLAESPYADEAFTQVRPLRDLFAALFFVSIGMLLDPKFVLAHALPIAATVAAILIGKTVAIAIPLRFLGWPTRTIALSALGLAQIGEFSFVLASLGAARKLINPEIAGVLLSAALITLLLAPFVFNAAPAIAKKIGKLRNEADTDDSDTKTSLPSTSSGAIVLGGGRVGRQVASALKEAGIAVTIIDDAAASLSRLRDEGFATIAGDALSEAVLRRADPQNLGLVAVALPDAAATEAAIRQLRQLAPSLVILARVHRGVDIPRMRDAGADAVIHAEFEAGAAMVREGLTRFDIPTIQRDATLAALGERRYRNEP